ncbi:MAG: hypothetical protein JNL98_19395 [Bryobacterales bacterium]|nr:hypothetical protein [Bryobacterales bacterium]
MALLWFFLALLPAQDSQLFDTYTNCARCHSSMRRPANAVNLPAISPLPVGQAALWRGSMMAHSSRDPYWKAKVRYEIAQTPAAAATIEDTCLRCHAPQQQYERRSRNATLKLDELNDLGREGVACTVCHQISPKALGTRASFTGDFTINEDRHIYGPHADPFAMPMDHMAGYTPREAPHIMESKLCATCHTVITPTLNVRGERTGEYVEQAPYLEWLRSSWADTGASCQSCHLPRLKNAGGNDVAQYIAHNPMGMFFPPTSPRRPFGLHTLAGANIPVLGMLKEMFPDEGPALDRTIAATWEMARSAAGLRLMPVRDGNQLRLAVQITNYAGHKLPTGFPSRRVWLHLKVSDGDGKVVFESGAWDENGEIRGLAGISPHQNEISNPAHTAIYETEAASEDGQPTTVLLRASKEIKDNRILPRGYNPSKPLPDGVPEEATRPIGTADDPDFVPGSDTVHYRIPSPLGPLQVEAELLYQSIRPAFVRPLQADRSQDEREFLSLYKRHSAPIRLTVASLRIE